MPDQKKKPSAHGKKAATKAFVEASSFQADPNGSYTGRPKDRKDKPVQDADDL